MRKLQQERKKKGLEEEEEKKKVKNLLITNSLNSVREYSDPIPDDILVDIFSRVPAKSIARFRCLSKFWKSILGRPDFTELFLTKSVARPRLFFVVAVYKDGLHIHENELVVFSSPQPQNPNDNSSLVATRYKTFPKYFPPGMLSMHCGLVFLQNWKKNARVIFNPATGESITLPKVEATGIDYSYLGFDPFSKQSKVLCMTWYGTPNTHQVLTLGTGKRKWRNVQDPLVPHYTSDEGICINGLLYYKAYFEGFYFFNIVCFDFRIEKFSLINMAEDMLSYYFRDYRLIFFNNKGKLGAIKYIERGDEKLIVLWVLEDAGKHKWSKRVCVLPPFWDNIIKKQRYKTVGMTGTGEIVFTPYKVSKHFHVFYYNIERSTFTRVNIHGFGEFKGRDPAIGTSLDYVETVQGFIT